MRFRQLKQLVNELTEEQLEQEVYFVEPYDHPALHEPDLLIAQEPILASTFDAEIQGDTRSIAEGMPYLG